MLDALQFVLRAREWTAGPVDDRVEERFEQNSGLADVAGFHGESSLAERHHSVVRVSRQARSRAAGDGHTRVANARRTEARELGGARVRQVASYGKNPFRFASFLGKYSSITKLSPHF